MKALTIPSTNYSRRQVGHQQAVSSPCTMQPGKRLPVCMMPCTSLLSAARVWDSRLNSVVEYEAQWKVYQVPAYGLGCITAMFFFP